MKLIEAINRVDSLIPNTYSKMEKVAWLSNLDTDIKTQIIDNYEGADQVTFAGYNENTPGDTVLLAAAPHDIMYLLWLEAMIHYHNEEFKKYNNALNMYNTAYSDFSKYYLRTHKPVGKAQFKL